MYLSFQQRLNEGFKKVRNRGYFAKQRHSCCTSCGIYELPDEVKQDGKFVFYHNQDTKCVKRNWVYLTWSGNGEEIRKCFLEAGLAVQWDGTEDQKIKVALAPTDVIFN